MKRRALCVLSVLVGIALAPSASAQNPKPSADRIRSAAEEYDAGRRALTENKFDEAAIHFENAFHDAPAAAAIRQAISARQKAGHNARAATEAALAQTKYPNDAPTHELVASVLADLEPKLQKVILACTPECSVVADGRAVSLEDSTRVVFYLDPGEHEIIAGWSEDRIKSAKVSAKPGGKVELTLEAPPPPPKPPPGEGVGPLGRRFDAPVAPPATKPLGPALFIVGSVLTVGGAVATIISGVDTLNNPGTDKVRTACVGKGESCPEYQQGVQAQTRTNILLGATIGAGVATVVIGAFFTQWSRPKSERLGLRLRPVLNLGSTSEIGLQGAF